METSQVHFPTGKSCSSEKVRSERLKNCLVTSNGCTEQRSGIQGEGRPRSRPCLRLSSG